MSGNAPVHLISLVSEVSVFPKGVFPMTFQVPESEAANAENQFEFCMPGSKKKFTIPLAKYISPEMAVVLATDPLATKRLLDEYAPGAWTMFKDSRQLEAWATAWRAASGIGLGESSASSSS